MEVLIWLLSIYILALDHLVLGLGRHLIADPHKGAHCMQQQAMTKHSF